MPGKAEVAPGGGSGGAPVALAGAGPRQGWAEAWGSWCSGRRWLRPVNWAALRADEGARSGAGRRSFEPRSTRGGPEMGFSGPCGRSREAGVMWQHRSGGGR